ncbi:hypothetical protein ACSQ67_000786 [Phaseolus vulgaris]
MRRSRHRLRSTKVTKAISIKSTLRHLLRITTATMITPVLLPSSKADNRANCSVLTCKCVKLDSVLLLLFARGLLFLVIILKVVSAVWCTWPVIALWTNAALMSYLICAGSGKY